MVQIREKGHVLDGERAVSGFDRGLPGDFYVPFVVGRAHRNGSIAHRRSLVSRGAQRGARLIQVAVQGLPRVSRHSMPSPTAIKVEERVA